MALVPMTELLSAAKCGEYAVCYCEAWNLESFEAVVEAAEESVSPIITGFNGGFLIHPERPKPENLACYAGMGAALRESSAPAAFLLNETDSFAQITRAIELGFNGVMVDNDHLEVKEYRQLVKKVVQRAHQARVAVEAAVGRLANGSGNAHAENTDPLLARDFVEETGIDALGVAVGNVHILTRGEAELDLEALQRISEFVPVPLVLHGGTSIPLERVQSYIRCRVAKINFGTVLKQAYLQAIRQKLEGYQEPMNPHLFVGMGGRDDLLMAGRNAVKEKVQELLVQCGSAGKAREVMSPELDRAKRP
jgi:fructose-bisphosphate aldolase class II